MKGWSPLDGGKTLQCYFEDGGQVKLKTAEAMEIAKASRALKVALIPVCVVRNHVAHANSSVSRSCQLGVAKEMQAAARKLAKAQKEKGGGGGGGGGGSGGRGGGGRGGVVALELAAEDFEGDNSSPTSGRSGRSAFSDGG